MSHISKVVSLAAAALLLVGGDRARRGPEQGAAKATDDPDTARADADANAPPGSGPVETGWGNRDHELLVRQAGGSVVAENPVWVQEHRDHKDNRSL